MREIPLTQGLVAIVDDEDFPALSLHKWSLHKGRYTNYAERGTADNKKIYMHRQIMGFPAGMIVDHENQNGLDNQKGNLRICTHAQNLRNQRRRNNKTSQFHGVHFDGQRRKWCAQIMDSETGKVRNLGRFDHEIDAARAYDAKAQAVEPGFAVVNFPDEL